jgi:hypothetical protein
MDIVITRDNFQTLMAWFFFQIPQVGVLQGSSTLINNKW